MTFNKPFEELTGLQRMIQNEYFIITKIKESIRLLKESGHHVTAAILQIELHKRYEYLGKAIVGEYDEYLDDPNRSTTPLDIP